MAEMDSNESYNDNYIRINKWINRIYKFSKKKKHECKKVARLKLRLRLNSTEWTRPRPGSRSSQHD